MKLPDFLRSLFLVALIIRLSQWSEAYARGNAQQAPLTAAQKNAILNNFNNYRAHPNSKYPAIAMNELAWNNDLETAIYDYYKSKVNSSWTLNQALNELYDTHTGCKQPPGFNTSKFYYCLFDLPEFQGFKAQKCRGVTLDSCKVDYQVKVLNYRFKKFDCFSYGACSTMQFTGYQTCNKTMNTRNGNDPCSIFWMYNPQFYRDNDQSVLVLATGAPPVVQPGQTAGYILFLCGAEAQPSNDVPYQSGSPGSNCSADRYPVRFPPIKNKYPNAGYLCRLKNT